MSNMGKQSNTKQTRKIVSAQATPGAFWKSFVIAGILLPVFVLIGYVFISMIMYARETGRALDDSDLFSRSLTVCIMSAVAILFAGHAFYYNLKHKVIPERLFFYLARCVFPMYMISIFECLIFACPYFYIVEHNAHMSFVAGFSGLVGLCCTLFLSYIWWKHGIPIKDTLAYRKGKLL